MFVNLNKKPPWIKWSQYLYPLSLLVQNTEIEWDLFHFYFFTQFRLIYANWLYFKSNRLLFFFNATIYTTKRCTFKRIKVNPKNTTRVHSDNEWSILNIVHSQVKETWNTKRILCNLFYKIQKNYCKVFFYLRKYAFSLLGFG